MANDLEVIFTPTAQCSQCRALLDESNGRIKVGVLQLCTANSEGNSGHHWKDYIYTDPEHGV